MTNGQDRRNGGERDPTHVNLSLGWRHSPGKRTSASETCGRSLVRVTRSGSSSPRCRAQGEKSLEQGRALGVYADMDGLRPGGRRGVDTCSRPRPLFSGVTLPPVVVFEIAGETWPLDDAVGASLAVSFRLGLAGGCDADRKADCAFLADAIEATLVGKSTEPIRVDEGPALALFQQLNASLKDPEAIDPAYSLYLAVRRYLGRLYS